MAHVHNEYLEDDEVEDQEGVQMEMVVEEPINTDVCMLPESTDDTRELCEDEKSALYTELKADAKSTEKVFVCDNSCFQRIEKCPFKYSCKELETLFISIFVMCL